MTRAELIADLTAVSAYDDEHASRRRVTIKHCYRGNAFSGILWSVVETQPHRFIHCDLMHYINGWWSYKPMVEADHPLYYSCPKKYLQLVPDGAPHTCAEWREKVREYHELAAQKRLNKKQLAAKY